MYVFESSRPVVSPLFFNRREELNFLLSSVKEVENSRGVSVLIVGSRRMGKTSLIREFLRLCEEKNVNVNFIVFSFSMVSDYETLVKELKNFLHSKVYNPLRKVKETFREVLETVKVNWKYLKFEPKPKDVIEILRNYMRSVAKYSEMNPTILIVDEFQRVQEIEEFSWILKGLIDEYPTFSFILTGSEYSLIKKAIGSKAGLFGVFTKTIHLTPIDEKECLNFLRKRYVEGGFNFDLEALKEIVKLSGGHPWILQKIGERTLRYGKEITIEVVRKAAEEIKEEVFDLLTRNYYDLDDGEKNVLAILPSTPKKIAMELNITPTMVHIILRNLIMKGFVKKEERGRYNYLNPYVESFCKGLPTVPLRERGKKIYEIVLQKLKEYKVADSKILSNATGFSKRTIQASIQYLRKKGYKIVTEKKGGKYRYIYQGLAKKGNNRFLRR